MNFDPQQTLNTLTDRHQISNTWLCRGHLPTCHLNIPPTDPCWQVRLWGPWPPGEGEICEVNSPAKTCNCKSYAATRRIQMRSWVDLPQRFRYFGPYYYYHHLYLFVCLSGWLLKTVLRIRWQNVWRVQTEHLIKLWLWFQWQSGCRKGIFNGNWYVSIAMLMNINSLEWLVTGTCDDKGLCSLSASDFITNIFHNCGLVQLWYVQKTLVWICKFCTVTELFVKCRCLYLFAVKSCYSSITCSMLLYIIVNSMHFIPSQFSCCCFYLFMQ